MTRAELAARLRGGLLFATGALLVGGVIGVVIKVAAFVVALLLVEVGR